MTGKQREELLAKLDDAVRAMARGDPEPLGDLLAEIIAALPN
jgi:hypothetical protein